MWHWTRKIRKSDHWGCGIDGAKTTTLVGWVLAEFKGLNRVVRHNRTLYNCLLVPTEHCRHSIELKLFESITSIPPLLDLRHPSWNFIIPAPIIIALVWLVRSTFNATLYKCIHQRSLPQKATKTAGEQLGVFWGSQNTDSELLSRL